MSHRPLASLIAGLALMGGLLGPAAAQAEWQPQISVLPPKRPASTAPQPASQPTPQTSPSALRTAAATPPAESSGPLNEQQVIERANTFFNGIKALVADFTQINTDGRQLTGTLYLQRPGKARFDYAPPSTLEVVADGTSVAVRDRKLATQDLYAISQTPLKFLLRDKVNLGSDVKVTDVTVEPGGVRLSLEDRSTLGGTSKIVLYFDPAVEKLSQWRITDPQGFVTTVMLSNIERGNSVDPKLFHINEERMLK